MPETITDETPIEVDSIRCTSSARALSNGNVHFSGYDCDIDGEPVHFRDFSNEGATETVDHGREFSIEPDSGYCIIETEYYTPGMNHPEKKFGREIEKNLRCE